MGLTIDSTPVIATTYLYQHSRDILLRDDSLDIFRKYSRIDLLRFANVVGIQISVDEVMHDSEGVVVRWSGRCCDCEWERAPQTQEYARHHVAHGSDLDWRRGPRGKSAIRS